MLIISISNSEQNLREPKDNSKFDDSQYEVYL